MDTQLVAMAVGVLAVGFVGFCLIDLARAEKVRYLPKWVWAILCLGLGDPLPGSGRSSAWVWV